MSEMDHKVAKELNKIADTIVQLESTCEKLEKAENKLTHFYQQEKAIHEIKKIIRACVKIEHLSEENTEEQLTDLQIIESLKDDNLKDITQTINKLELDLEKLSESQDSKVKSFIHQRKAMHEIKKILHKANIITSLDEDELRDINNLL